MKNRCHVIPWTDNMAKKPAQIHLITWVLLILVSGVLLGICIEILSDQAEFERDPRMQERLQIAEVARRFWVARIVSVGQMLGTSLLVLYVVWAVSENWIAKRKQEKH